MPQLPAPGARQPVLMTTPDITMDSFDTMFLPGGGIGGLPSGEAYNMNFDEFTNDTGTISPHDLHNDPLVMSNPPSTAFPNLSTPDSSFLESPAMASSGLNTSPLDDGLLDSTLDFNSLDSMTPLFPQGSYDQFASVNDNHLHQSNSFSSINSRPVSSTSASASPMVRQKSSPGRPPAPYPAHVHARKHSETAGIHKATAAAAAKQRKSLPEILIDDEDDKETAKRKKNTAAARKSRMRKQNMYEEMAGEIDRLRSIIYSIGGDPDADHPQID